MALARQILPRMAPTMRVAAFAQAQRTYSTHMEEYGDAWNKKWVAYFNNPNLRKNALHRGLNDVFAHDLIPEVEIMEAALDASRRVNSFGTGVRILEGLREKVEKKADYEYLVGQLRPTLDKHGINTPEELGFV